MENLENSLLGSFSKSCGVKKRGKKGVDQPKLKEASTGLIIREIEKRGLRFIPGASGACAARAPARFNLGEPCAECQKPIVESDDDVWYCDNYWLKKKGRGMTIWHSNCLKSGLPST